MKAKTIGHSELNPQERKKRKAAPKKAALAAKWAEIMTKQLIRCKSEKYWQIVSFKGLKGKGSESTGIVDAIAIRKDHKSKSKVFQPGDHFDIVIIQIKGSEKRAGWPSKCDNRRMCEVGKFYHAKCVLSRWQRYDLRKVYLLDESSLEWKDIKPEQIFK